MMRYLVSLFILLILCSSSQAQYDRGAYDTGASISSGMLASAFPDSGNALLARADSTKIPNGKLAVSTVNQLSVLLGLLQTKAAVKDSILAWITRNVDFVDSTKMASNSGAIGDIAALSTRLSEKMTSVAFPDSVTAALARADSNKFGANKLSISLINELATRLAEKLTASSTADSIRALLGKEYSLPLPAFADTTASAKDSTTVRGIVDIDATKGKKKLLFVYGNASTAVDSTIWAETFYPMYAFSDSAYWWAATSDSSLTSYSVSIWDKDGSRIFSSGDITFTNSNVFERKSFPLTTQFAVDEYCIVYRFRVATAASTIKMGQVYVKKN